MKFLKYFLLLLPFFLVQCKKEKIKTNDLNFSATAGGCGSFFVYKINTGGKVGLVVKGDREALGLTTQQQTFNLENTPDLEVLLHKHKKSAQGYYCDDVLEQDEEIVSTYQSVEGQVHLQITADSISVSPWETTYKLDVIIENVLLENDNGDQLQIESESFLDVLVGWLPG